ncbi:MAG: peptide chain release factor N(5)-glutamine methyltransferase [Spiroplasma sp.]|nr:peptide chain release factor N(5)-glutamine methyltransferase [Spiroplasma sp.]
MKYYQFLSLARKINQNENVNKLILANLLEKNLTWIYANLNVVNTDRFFLQKYLSLVKKYASGWPLAYLSGHVFFYNYKIFVNEDVLIPRNETELLVSRVLFWSQKLFSFMPIKVLDLGTGSGCIAISLALKKPEWQIFASDISDKALEIAKLNQEFYHLDRLTLVKSDLFNNLTNEKFDIIISNPPYIDKSKKDYQINNLKHEPELALFADNFGLAYYQKILASVLNFTNKDFLIAFEIGFDQKSALESILALNFQNYFYWFEKDYSNHWRFLFISSCKL